MNYELAQAYARGEMPADCYRVPDTVPALVAIIEELQSGGTIRRDTPPGHGFTFGRTVGGRWAFLSDEFTDNEETVPNADFHKRTFDTVADGVAHFTINGLALFECVKGCRFWARDIGTIYPDYCSQEYAERFGDPAKAMDAMPWQISPKCANWQVPFERVVEDDPRLSGLFERCLSRGTPFTVRELVDALYLSADGSYTFHEVETRDYEDFIRRVSALEFNY